jgi:hypothetical protein
MKCLCADGHPVFDVPADIIPSKSLTNRLVSDLVRDSCSLCRISGRRFHRPGASLRKPQKSKEHRVFPPVSPSADLGTSNSAAAAQAGSEIRRRQATFSSSHDQTNESWPEQRTPGATTRRACAWGQSRRSFWAACRPSDLSACPFFRPTCNAPCCQRSGSASCNRFIGIPAEKYCEDSCNRNLTMALVQKGTDPNLQEILLSSDSGQPKPPKCPNGEYLCGPKYQCADGECLCGPKRECAGEECLSSAKCRCADGGDNGKRARGPTRECTSAPVGPPARSARGFHSRSVVETGTRFSRRATERVVSSCNPTEMGHAPRGIIVFPARLLPLYPFPDVFLYRSRRHGGLAVLPRCRHRGDHELVWPVGSAGLCCTERFPSF